MTDTEMLELILEKVVGLENDVKEVKKQLKKSTAELKAMDDMIFDEVERVHDILYKHTENKSIHKTA